ncbi:MAG TPA: VWA domain-containing protein [Candidatus Polarisedimenticolia bacterium]|jgi:VWFA-related protein
MPAAGAVLLLAAALVALPLAASTPPAEGGPFLVRIVSPTAAGAVIGRTDILVEVKPPEGVTIFKVELYVDDTLLATLLDPPWRLSWDAGDTLRPRTIRARAYASDGTRSGDRVTTAAVVGVQRARVTLVQVYATVRDQQGRYLTDLSSGDFTILEAGRAQEVAVFSAERKPASLVLLLDTSASMRQDERLDTAKEAAVGFVEALEPDDTAAVVSFSDAPRILQERTSNKEALRPAILSTQPRGGTALYDAIIAAVDRLKEVEGKKAIILLSDGRDEAADGLGPGSAHTFEEALEAVLRSETVVYAIGTGEKLEEQPDFNHRRTLGEILRTLSTRSGGRAYFVKKAAKLKDAYGRIEDELRHQYTLAYYPASEGASGWRPIEVRVSRPRARITTREGYYAK